jgi:WD40 repeat protein
MRNAISRAVRQQGERLLRITPSAIAVGLVSAALLPAMLGDLSPASPVLAGTLGLLSKLGGGVLKDLVDDFLKRLRERREKGQAPSEVEIREQLENELLQQWEAGGEAAAALRADASRLLQAVQGVETALAAATDDVKQALAQGLADLGGRFHEFRWMLDEVQQILAEMRTKQALQLALQREQLDLQRQQLVKTNLLLRLQQERVAVPTPLGLPYADEKEISPADVPCPYKGLATFEPEDAGYFFGREELVAELIARLAGTRFLAVVGPSGSGKSSVVRAGLLPAIWQDGLPHSKDWQTLILTPGQHPLEELAIRISLLRQIAPGSLLKDLKTDSQALALAVKQALADQPDHVCLLLVVDQFEEAFALCHDEAERRQFIDALLHAVEARNSRTVVVPTIRADFYGHCADYPNLAAKLQDSVLVGPLSEGELRQVIERPADLVGLVLEPGLVETIMGDVANEPGALPLLSHALLETWQRRRGHTLTLAGYTESGGVTGAIAQTADSVLQQLTPEQQSIARSVFLRLTELGEEGSQDTRRRVAPAELIRTPAETPMVEAVLTTLADARLITTGEETVEVAHEALIREWPALRGWLDEDREGLRTHRHLTEAAQEWQRLAREPGELYRGARLATASEWAEEHAEALNPLEREFLEASQELAHREEAEREAQRQRELEAAQKVAEAERRRAEEQARATSRLRRLAAALAAVFLLAVAAAVFAITQQQQAQDQAHRAEREARLATARALGAQALASLDDRLDLALLLSMESFQLEETLTSGTTLLAGLFHSPHLTTFLHGHINEVLSIAFSPDGKVLASAGSDNTIRLWDVATGQLIGQPLTGHTNWVNSVAFSPDGKILASGSADATIRLWDTSTMLSANAATGQPAVDVLTGHMSGVESVVFSPDGTILASGSGDHTIRLWDVVTREPIGEPLTGHAEGVRSLAFSPDGTILASGSLDNSIRLWDVATGEPIGQPLIGHTNWVNSVAFSPNGKMLASGSFDRSIRLWDVERHQPFASPLSGHTNGVYSVAFSPDGQKLISGSQDRTLRLWDVATGEPIGEPFTGHSHWVWSVAFSPDGQTLASGGGDGTVILWSVTARQPLSRRLGDYPDTPYSRTQWVLGVAFSPDGKTVAAASSDHTLRLWDVATHQPIGQPLIGHTDRVSSVAFSPDGEILASGSADATIILWDMATSQPIGQPLTGHTNWVYSIAFSPDGQTLASGAWDHTVRLWDISTMLSAGVAMGQPTVRLLTGHDDPVRSVAFSPDGKTLASGSCGQLELDQYVCDKPGEIRLWDVATGQPIGQPLKGHTFGVESVVFSPDGQTLASSSDDGTICLWDTSTMLSAGVATGQPIGQPLKGHTHWVMDVDFSPDGTILASAGVGDLTIRLWDVATGQPIGQPLTGHTHWVMDIAFSPDGQTVASGSRDGTIRLWDVATGQPLGGPLGQPFTGHEDAVYSVAFSPDGTTLASGSYDTTIRLWDVATSEPIGLPLTGHSNGVNSVAFSPDGQTIASGSFDHTIRLWDVATSEPIGEPLTGHTDEVWAVVFSPDGKTLASASQDHTIRLWDAATGEPVGEALTGHKAEVNCLAFTHEGILASGSNDNIIILWDVTSGQPIGKPLVGHTDWVNSVAFSPDGKTLASASDDSTIILWDVATGDAIGQPLVGHTDEVWTVAFSPDGKTLASGSADNTVRLWDAATGALLVQSLTGHSHWVNSVAFSPDGRTLASGSEDGTIILWDARIASWQAQACRIANRNLTPEEWEQYLGDEPYRKTCPGLP